MLGACRGQKNCKLQMIVRYYVGARNPSSLEEQPVFLTAEPSPSPSVLVFEAGSTL